MPRRPNSSVAAIAAIFAVIALILSGCTSASSGAAAVDSAGFASMSSAAASSSAAAEASRIAEQQRQLQLASDLAVDRAEAAKDKAIKAAKAEATRVKAEKAAKAKATKAKAAKEKAAKAKAAKAKAAKEKAAKEKAAKAKAAKEKAAKAKAAKEKAERERAAARFDLLTGGIRSNNPVVAVKIDNTRGGRPQYGLNSADVVYVEQVEGGLTRLIALFHSQLPTEVGPVRSVRTTDIEALRAYGTPLIAFSGGAGGPLAALAASPLIDASGLPGYWRSGAKPAPYNLHVNLRQLVDAAPAKPKPKAPGFTFATKHAGLTKAPVRHNVRVVMRAGDTGFTYTGNSTYRVNNGGEPAVDAAGNPITTSNVLVQRVVDRPDGTVDTNGQPSMLSRTVGKGDFTLYRNGRALHGRWFRFSEDGPTKFLDAKGKPIPLDRGRTWVMLAPQSAVITSW